MRVVGPAFYDESGKRIADVPGIGTSATMRWRFVNDEGAPIEGHFVISQSRADANIIGASVVVDYAAIEGGKVKGGLEPLGQFELSRGVSQGSNFRLDGQTVWQFEVGMTSGGVHLPDLQVDDSCLSDLLPGPIEKGTAAVSVDPLDDLDADLGGHQHAPPEKTPVPADDRGHQGVIGQQPGQPTKKGVAERAKEALGLGEPKPELVKKAGWEEDWQDR